MPCKKSASTYDIELPDISFEDFHEIDLDINIEDFPPLILMELKRSEYNASRLNRSCS